MGLPLGWVWFSEISIGTLLAIGLEYRLRNIERKCFVYSPDRENPEYDYCVFRPQRPVMPV